MGTTTLEGPRDLCAAALARKRERRNHYESYSETERLRARLEDRALPSVSVMAPELRDPESVPEFFDDRIVEWGKLLNDPAAPVLLAVAAAARESAQAAVQAVGAARRLDRQAQWVIYQNLRAWHGHHDAARTGSGRALGAVLAEWSRLGLAEEDPDGE